MSKPFWQTKTLEQMTPQEWESLCDGCAKCCLHKLIDDDSAEQATDTEEIAEHEELYFTNIACRYLNDKKCECTVYSQRTKLVPSCIQLTQDNLEQVFYMPSSCTYRRLQEGRGLPSWHPLLHKNKKSKMHQAGMSVRGKVVFDDMVSEEQYEDFIVLWPLEDVE
ncbi:MAG: YcgN family cysteine cluster protein [Gammaproteobacteria bacterium]|nr:YcgN family cysteine cluster protein [Gammaproteobacteria bacterium]